MELMTPSMLSRSRLHPSSHFEFFSGFCKLAPDRGMSISMLYSNRQYVPFQSFFLGRWAHSEFRSHNYQLQEQKNRRILNPSLATSSGLEASMLDPKDSNLTLKMVEIVVESKDASKIQLRVDVHGEETQKAFDVVLTNLGRTAPPIPGFRRQKGGKTSQVPKGILLNMLGEERVTKFTIQEIVTSVLSDYVQKQNLVVKDKKISTTQTEDELRLSFSPGSAFGFNVTLELEEA